MSTITIRQAVVDTIAAALPALRACEAHGGRFDAKELQRVSTKSPAVLVAITRATGIDLVHGQRAGELTFAAFVCTRDTAEATRADMALQILDGLAGIIPGNRWGLDDAQSEPRSINAQNLFSAGVDRQGVALWGVSWTQSFVLSTDVDMDALNDFLTTVVDYDLDTQQDGDPVGQDNISLPQV